MPRFTKDRRERHAPWDEYNSRRWRAKFLISDAVKDAKVAVRWMRAEGKQYAFRQIPPVFSTAQQCIWLLCPEPATSL